MLTQEQQIFDLIEKSKNILVAVPKNENGDNIASALALVLSIKKLGKTVELIQEGFKPSTNISFLPGISELKSGSEALQKFIISLNLKETQVSQVKYAVEGDRLNFIIIPKNGFFTHSDITSHSGDFKYDLVITVGSPDLESLGMIYEQNTEFFYKTTVVNIDHEPGNEAFGQVNLVDLTAVSNAEIIYSLISRYDGNLIDPDIASCLLSGMIIKTKGFKAPIITPQSLAVSAKLIELGARREEIMNNLYRSRSLSSLKLWGRVLARLSSSQGDALVWSVLTQADFTKTGADEQDLFEVIDELIINIPQAKVVVLIHELTAPDGSGQTKALIYSTRNIDSLYLAKEYNPTGTKHLASVLLHGNLQSASNELISNIENQLRKIPL
jgi:phosphoesterase RecJ-like protein